MTAARFGDCKCGFPKLDHNKAAIPSSLNAGGGAKKAPAWLQQSSSGGGNGSAKALAPGKLTPGANVAASSAPPAHVETATNSLESKTGMDLDGDGDVGIVGAPGGPRPLSHSSSHVGQSFTGQI